MTDKFTRRKTLKALGAGGLAATAGCLSVLEGEDEWEQQLETLRDEFGHYDQNWEAAYEDGFQPMGPLVPNMGWHFLNLEYVQNAAERGGFVLEEPAILNFDQNGNIGAVEYGAPLATVPDEPDLIAGDPPDPVTWQPHFAATHLFAFDNGEYTPMEDATLDELLVNEHWTEFQPPDAEIEVGEESEQYWGRAIMPTDLDIDEEEATPDDAEPETRIVDGVMQHDDLNALHVWAFADNPDSMFAPFNPDFANI